MTSGWIHEVSTITKEKRDHVIVTLAGIRGSAPQEVGSKMIVTAEGRYWGTVGGGKIEAHCIAHAMQLLCEGGGSQLKVWNLQTDIGMSCGGEVSLFFDCNYFSNWTVAVFGAGHISQELCRVMSSWSCQLTVLDTRAEWVEKLTPAPNLEARVSENLAAEVAGLPDGAYVLSMTQGYATDLPILQEVLKTPERFAFIGVIGSRIKAGKIRRELLELGVAQETVQGMVCPLGLPLGNNTPPEISISIAAQILQHRTPRESL